MRGFLMRAFFVSIATLAFCGFAVPANATTITYSISATVSGKIGAVTFTNALVTVTLLGDTSTIKNETFGGLIPNAKVNVGIGTVNISGIGTATITGCTSTPNCPGPIAIYSFPTPVSFPDLPTAPFVLIGTIDFPPATTDFTGLAAVVSNALLGYELQPSGPISDTPGGVFYPTGLFVHTTRGDLSFTSNFEPGMGPGTFTATAIPEPSSLLSLSSALLLCGHFVFRNRAATKERVKVCVYTRREP